ncbi:Nudix family hydrolase [Aquitalea magnusonii]|uniref:8-oxo-dGTP diphosphatase n=1 Tax=Aquitalea magnusonii TaxID=332411 RepID=A0A318J6R8_9NEIS|nr:Nudix family hydrolase [Aquitalea magnusonii]PXX42859.1 8-oxo-dGTP diphosphatase [Aquitalea magnusonii]
MHSDNKIIEVVAGVLMRPDGSFMLGSRPQGKPYAGYWEFPGGKVEPGESALQALVRELQEEMAITVTHATPWLSRLHHYEHASVHLRFFRVWDWQGEPQPQEGQQFAWQPPGPSSVEPMLPANGPILKSLQLPAVYAITCAHEIGVAAQLQALATGPAHGLVQVREPDMDRQQLQAFVSEVAAIVHARGGKVVVNADPAWLAGWPVDGVHLNGSRLRQLTQRPDIAWVGASVHSAAELQQAGLLGLDYALLGHVQPTASHPGVTPLGWDGFASVLAAGMPLPVYALGGLQAQDLETARQHGAHGVALMRGAWQ